MAIEFQPVSINFGQGIDTKTESKMVVNGKLLDLQNAIFTQYKEIAKCDGNSSITFNIVGGGTLTSPKMVHSYNNELVCADNGYLYSYSQTLLGWVNKGFYPSVKVSSQPISSAANQELSQNSAIIGNYQCFVYSYQDNTTTSFIVYVSIIDLTTGSQILSNYGLASSTSLTPLPSPKVIALANAKFAIFYSDSSGHLDFKIVTISLGGGVTFGVAQSITTTINYLNGYAQYDVVGTSTGACIAYGRQDGTLQIRTLDSSGSVTHSDSHSTPDPGAIFINPDASGNFWIYWADFTTLGSETIRYLIASPTLTSVLAVTTIASGVSHISQIAVSTLTLTTQMVMYSIAQTTSGSSSYNILSKTVNSTGTVSAGTFSIDGVDIYTRPFAVSGKNYLGVLFLSSVQGTVFFLSIDSVTSGYVIAKALVGSATATTLPIGMICPVVSYSSTSLGIPSQVVLQAQISGSASHQQLIGSTLINLDFNHADAFRATEVGGVLLLNGGIVSMYDGAVVTEVGFHVFPEIISATGIATGGSLQNSATYHYIAIYQWIDAHGNLYQSAIGQATVTTPSGAGSAASVTLIVRSLSLSQKQSASAAWIVLYRTQASGTTYGQVIAAGVAIANSGEGVTIIDIVADASIPSDGLPYTDGSNGSVLDNDPPPPSMNLVRHNNRVWALDSENPNSVWYSKTLSPLNGVSFSGNLLIDVDTKYGSTTALAEMDANLVGFKQIAPYIITGDGANDTGSGSTLSQAQFIPSDAGCNASKSVITMPFGVMFKSDKGFYLLDRSLGVSYIGAEVEAYNSAVITSSVLIDNHNQIRFTTQAGPGLIYDYFFKQWGTFPGQTGLSADIWQGNYVYTSGASIFEDTAGYYLNGSTAYALLAKTAWIKMSAIQGFQRVTDLMLLGTYANGASASHAIQVTINYDFGNGFTPSRGPFTFYFGAANASGPFQCELPLPIQKCESIQFIVTEVTTGDSAETMTLEDMSLRVGIKMGLYKLPASNKMR